MTSQFRRIRHLGWLDWAVLALSFLLQLSARICRLQAFISLMVWLLGNWLIMTCKLVRLVGWNTLYWPFHRDAWMLLWQGSYWPPTSDPRALGTIVPLMTKFGQSHPIAFCWSQGLAMIQVRRRLHKSINNKARIIENVTIILWSRAHPSQLHIQQQSGWRHLSISISIQRKLEFSEQERNKKDKGCKSIFKD